MRIILLSLRHGGWHTVVTMLLAVLTLATESPSPRPKPARKGKRSDAPPDVPDVQSLEGDLETFKRPDVWASWSPADVQGDTPVPGAPARRRKLQLPGEIGYSMCRVHFTETREDVGALQLSEVHFSDGAGEAVSFNVSAPGGINPDSEGPENLADGDVGTKVRQTFVLDSPPPSNH